MAGVKITALNPLATADDADVLVLVDVSDGPDGTTKKITYSNFISRIDSVEKATESLISETTNNVNVQNYSSTSDIYNILLSDGNGTVQVGTDDTLTYDTSTGTLTVTSLSATDISGSGASITNIDTNNITNFESVVQGIADASSLWDSYQDGSRIVARAQYNLYMDATEGGDGTQTYLQGGDQTELDIVASGANAFTGLSTSQPWTSILAYGPDGTQYTSALMGLDQTGIHTRYGHIKITSTQAEYNALQHVFQATAGNLTVVADNLPITDPVVLGQLWRDSDEGNVIKVSRG
jgi:hypothetical protein